MAACRLNLEKKESILKTIGFSESLLRYNRIQY